MTSDMEEHCPDQPAMTIFYSGKLNIYPNVSAEKAKAIMLLLSNDRTADCMLPLAVKGGVPSACTTNSARQPSRPPPSPGAASQNKGIVKRSQAELPFARKVSLTRFLEKRKERMEARPKETCQGSDLTAKDENEDFGPCKRMK